VVVAPSKIELITTASDSERGLILRFESADPARPKDAPVVSMFLLSNEAALRLQQTLTDALRVTNHHTH
jgi:hypothetical protein